jgi:hypothetical protein
MAISASDILYKLSIKTGAAGNSAAQGDPNASLGKYISQTQTSATALNNLFDNVSGPENAASDVEYRCVFVHNNHGSLSLQGPVIYLLSEVSGGCAMAIAVDSTAASAIGSSSAQALSVADESTAPVGLTFTSPTTLATGLALGDIPAGYCKAFWIRRTAANTVAVDADGGTIRLAGGTAA